MEYHTLDQHVLDLYVFFKWIFSISKIKFVKVIQQCFSGGTSRLDESNLGVISWFRNVNVSERTHGTDLAILRS